VKMKTNDKEDKVNWINESLIIAFFPLFAYLLAFCHEAGFTSIFGIPKEFIIIDLATVFIVAGALLSISIVLFSFLYFITFNIKWNSINQNPFYRSIIKSLFFIIPCIIYIVIYGRLWREWIYIVIFVLVMLFLEFGFPLFTQRNKDSYYEKLEAQEKYDL